MNVSWAKKIFSVILDNIKRVINNLTVFHYKKVKYCVCHVYQQSFGYKDGYDEFHLK